MSRAGIRASLGSFEQRLTVWARWAVLFLVLLLLAVDPGLGVDRGTGLYLAVAGAAAYNILLFFSSAATLAWLRRRWITLGVDLAFTTLLVLFTSGGASRFFYLYLLCILWAALAGGKRTALAASALAAALYGSVLASRGELVPDPAYLSDQLFRVGLLALTALWAGLIADQQGMWSRRTSELSTIADQWSKAATDIQSAALFGIGALLASSDSIEETLNLTLDAVEDIIQSDRCSILLLDSGTNELVLRAARGMRAGMVGKLRLKGDQGIAGQVLSSGQPRSVPDTDKDPLFVPSPSGYDKIRSMLVVPLIVREKRIGVINISEVREARRFTARDLEAITLVASYAALALENAGIMEEMEKQAVTDGLTGLYNYRFFSQRLAAAVREAGPGGRGLALIWMDLDHFKEYNDTFGHLKGSEILKRLGGIIDRAVGPADKVICRYGGDEFAVILPGADRDGALAAAERIRLAIGGTEFAEHRPGGLQLSASLGVACFPEDAAEPRALIEKADQAMYRAKQRGKNRTAFWRGPTIHIRSVTA
ncbi:MAG: sensor domain-containing diguanylate cyclase [Candidatus Edwardsbacteria bacterium]|nr:sensor domain-containing diguanylate cyclase [Candidatus Edwardsbacteria bacterium]